jgi:hypothetical protein
VNLNDPTGHTVCEDSYYGCSGKHPTAPSYLRFGSDDYWKWAIKSVSGITMTGSNGKWSTINLQNALYALAMWNDALNGHLKSMVGGTTFTMASQATCADGNRSYECYH